MNSLQEFDIFLIKLHEDIRTHPELREMLIDSAMRQAPCPYLQKRIMSAITTSSDVYLVLVSPNLTSDSDCLPGRVTRLLHY